MGEREKNTPGIIWLLSRLRALRGYHIMRENAMGERYLHFPHRFCISFQNFRICFVISIQYGCLDNSERGDIAGELTTKIKELSSFHEIRREL